MLRLHEVEAGYGSAQVLFGVSFMIEPGACVSLMGRNGMGKTTTVRTIMGQLPLRGDEVQEAPHVQNGLRTVLLAMAWWFHMYQHICRGRLSGDCAPEPLSRVSVIDMRASRVGNAFNQRKFTAAPQALLAWPVRH